MTNPENIPEVTLSDAQAERAYRLKAQWERPNRQLLIPITLTRYVVYLQDALAAPHGASHYHQNCATCTCREPVEIRDPYRPENTADV